MTEFKDGTSEEQITYNEQQQFNDHVEYILFVQYTVQQNKLKI